MLKLLSASLLVLLSTQVWAGADCPDVPENQWMTKRAMQKKIINDYGFVIKKFKIDDNCYEIYGWEVDAQGRESKKIEVYFNPVSGEIVKKKDD
jgi:hypothetical protein